jgi:hypothetical protein
MTKTTLSQTTFFLAAAFGCFIAGDASAACPTLPSTAVTCVPLVSPWSGLDLDGFDLARSCEAGAGAAASGHTGVVDDEDVAAVNDALSNGRRVWIEVGTQGYLEVGAAHGNWAEVMFDLEFWIDGDGVGAPDVLSRRPELRSAPAASRVLRSRTWCYDVDSSADAAVFEANFGAIAQISCAVQGPLAIAEVTTAPEVICYEN